MGTPRIPSYALICIRSWSSRTATGFESRPFSSANCFGRVVILFYFIIYFIELFCFVFQWCYKIWGMEFQQKSIYVSILALTGWTIFFIQCINQKSKWNGKSGKSQSENIDFLRIFSEIELLVCFRTIVKTMKNWENAVCVSTISVFIKLDSRTVPLDSNAI